ncbi:hypothetical protein [Maribacter sp.]|uniref:hypothetical protein n=1 Tax=Maribacter sp. TaxID=1897614 RepID=UPI0025C6D9C0|nr:hypothetical protein [Maribacter sp.]
MEKTRNKYKHRWNETSKGSYNYRCEKCLARRSKLDAYTYGYWEFARTDVKLLKAPECVPN